jgi:hypothetical protein
MWPDDSTPIGLMIVAWVLAIGAIICVFGVICSLVIDIIGRCIGAYRAREEVATEEYAVAGDL